jgi:hypothetical protein
MARPKTHDKEDYGATGQTKDKPAVEQGTPMPDGRQKPALHDVEGDPDTAKTRRDIEKGA